MKLILASKEKFLLDRGYDLLGIPRKDLKIGMITTAVKVSDEQYIKYMKEYIELMKSSGIDFKEFDIDGKNEEEIREFFIDRNVVQVSGGSPFFLLKKVRESGFDVVLKDLIKAGYPYIGCSSGSHLMTPTIEVGGWKVGRNRFGVLDFTTLGYVPFLIKSHFTDDIKEEMIQKTKTLKYPLRVLKDDQCFYIENGVVQFYGNSEEVIL